MDLAVTTEQRLYRTPDRAIRASLLHGFWRRYRHAFSGVRVVARVFEATAAEQRFGRVDEDGVTVVDLPPFDGLLSLAAGYRELRRRVEPLAASDAALLLRLPSIYAARIGRRLARAGKPFGVEILGDPADALSRGSLRHPARMLLRRLACAELRWACDRACATAYVTRSALQRRYPPRPGCFTTQVSSVELDDDDFAAARPDRRPPHDAVAIVHVGTFSQPYKGQDLILDAVRTLARSGVHVRATLIGEGRHRPALEVRARASGLEAQVEFTGEIRERAELRRRLDAADLFVFPSRAEGLPRALIEAMARGLPCVATAVGGIRELLPPEALCPVGDADALAARIAAVARDRESARRMAEANLATAREYHRSVLRPRAQAFQERLREETAAWHRARSGR